MASKKKATPEEENAQIVASASDALKAPVAQGGVEIMHPDMVGVHPDIQFKRGGDPETGVKPLEGPVGHYDVDKGGTLLGWRRHDGSTFVVDGHHRLNRAKLAENFVSSKLQKGDYVPVKREIPVRLLHESDGWTQQLVKEQGRAANTGEAASIDSEETEEVKRKKEGRKEEAEVIEAEEEAAASLDSTETHVEFDILACDSVDSVQILGKDSKTGELRIKQKASRADCLNDNGRVYPHAVLDAAAKDADKRAKKGLLTSEFEHPNIGRECKGGICKEKFFDNPDRKTATIDSVGPIDDDGWLWITRTIKDTPYGRQVKDAIESRRPLGISTRFHVTGQIKEWKGQRVLVADSMTISTWDDVGNPAFKGAGAFVPVTDSALSLLTGDSLSSSPYLGEPFTGENCNTVNPPSMQYEDPDQGQEADSRRLAKDKNMLTDIKRLMADFAKNYAKPGAMQSSYTADGCRIVQALKAAKDEGICIQDSLKELRALVDSGTVAGYRGGTIEVTVGSEIGGTPGDGWGSSIETATGMGKMTAGESSPEVHEHGTGAMKSSAKGAGDATDPVIEEMKAKHVAAAKDSAISAALDKAADEHDELNKEDDETKEEVKKVVKDSATSPDFNFKSAIDTQLSLVHKALARGRKEAKGIVRGKTVTDGEEKPTSVITKVNEHNPYLPLTDKMLAMADSECRRLRGSDGIVDPDSADTIALRKLNRKLLEPVLDDFTQKVMGSANVDSFRAAMDSCDRGEMALAEIVEPYKNKSVRDLAAADATTTATIFNQPEIMMTLLIQQFQDLTAFQHVGAMGPRKFDSKSGGFSEGGRFGTELRLPSYSYTDPTGWGYQDARVDFGLLTPEGQGIAPGNTNVSWWSYSIQRRRLAAILTWDAIKSIGNGPANLPLLSLELWMMAGKHSRVIDRALYNEMLNSTYEFLAVQASAETNTTGNNLLPNNSVFPGSGAVTVNLNPQKTAVATVVATTDLSVTYPASVPAGQVAIVGALRLKAGAVNSNAAPYYGIKTAQIGPGPIVRPRLDTQLPATGAPSTVTYNPITVTAPAAQVQGEVSAAGGIVSYPGTTATFAIDYEEGLIVFAASSGIAGSGGVMTTTVTLTYSYGTNWDEFLTDEAMSLAANLWGTGTTYQDYLNNFLMQIDNTGSIMGSSTNFVKPDTCIMNLVGSVPVKNARNFSPLFSPPGTNLYPSPTIFAERDGVNFHRHNTPWNGLSRTALLTRRGATKYAIDTPWNIQGPVTVQDSNGNPTGELSYYGQEFSTMATPMPRDFNGNILNCPNRSVLMRMQKEYVGNL